MKLDKLFNPKSIAVIGASEEVNTVGFGLINNVLLGKDFRKIFCINPSREKVFGMDCFKKITDIKEDIDLVVIAIPAKFVIDVVKDCVIKKVKGIVIISNGFKESDEEGKKREEEIKLITKKAGIYLIGPNCLGILNPLKNLNASFAPINPKKGNIAFLSQSGALLDSILGESSEQRFGYSKIVSYGNEAGLSLCDFLEYLKDDEETKVIAMYFEGLNEGRRFMDLASVITKTKPIVAIKAGRSKAGASAALTHTGSLAGDYKIYEAAMKQAGVIFVDDLQELFDVSKILAWQPRIKNNNIGIVTNGGGLGILTVDYCEVYGLNVPALSEKTLKYLESQPSMAKVAVKHNPLDVIGDALADRYEVSVESLLKQKDIDAVIVISTPQIMTEHEKSAKIIVELMKKYPNKAIVTCFVGGVLTAGAIKYLEENNVPNYNDPKRAVKSIKSLTI